MILFNTGLPPDAGHLIPGSFFLRSRYAGLILDNEEILQAEPRGARIRQAESLWDDDEDVTISDSPIQRWAESTVFPQSLGAREIAVHDKRGEVCAKARYMEGTPYTLLDMVTLKCRKTPGRADRLADARHLTPAALVDRAYAWSEIHLFTDGRLTGDVNRWDLENYVHWHEAERLMRLVEEHRP